MLLRQFGPQLGWINPTAIEITKLIEFVHDTADKLIYSESKREHDGAWLAGIGAEIWKDVAVARRLLWQTRI